MATNISKIQVKKVAQRIDNPVRFRQRLLNIQESARYLGRGVDSMRELIYSHEVKIIQRGDSGKIWVDVHDLDVWIEANKKYA